MLEEIRESVLRRKLVPKAEMPAFEFSAPPLEQEPAGGRLLPRSFIRAASRVADMVARASVRSSRGVGLAELVELPAAEGFTALLKGPDGPPGLVILDPSAFSSVIEAMTIGSLSRKPPALRRATETDAALMADLVDAILAEVDANPDPADPFDPGYRQHRLVDDLRLLDVMLEDVPFTLTVLEVELLAEGTVRKGMLSIALPEPAPEIPTFSDFDIPLDDGPLHDVRWERALEASVMTAPAQLGAVLGRVRMPLSEVMALKVDSLVTLPLSQLEEVQLEGLDRAVLAVGRLGQYRGMRALRLTALHGEAGAEPVFETAPRGDSARTLPTEPQQVQESPDEG